MKYAKLKLLKVSFCVPKVMCTLFQLYAPRMHLSIRSNQTQHLWLSFVYAMMSTVSYSRLRFYISTSHLMLVYFCHCSLK